MGDPMAAFSTEPMPAGPGRPRPGDARLDRISNAVIGGLLRLGAPLGPMALLTVPGRVSGQPRTTPVAVLPFEGGWRVTAPYGVVDWVKNLRSAGHATLTHRGSTITVEATELDLDEAAPLLRATMTDSGRLTRRVLAPHFSASVDDPDEAWLAEAHVKPMFRLAPLALPVDRASALLQSLIGLLVVGILAQVVLAGLGAFGLIEGWQWHRVNGVVVEAIALTTAAVALAARRVGVRWLTVGIFVLVAFQHGTSAVGGLAGGVHALNAMAMFSMAGVARRRLRSAGASRLLRTEQ